MTTTVDEADLPRALVKRIVKQKLSQLEPTPQDGVRKEFQLNKDSLLAISESAKVFITYITAAANDACKEGKRQTMSEADVLTALTDLDFGELIPALKESMEAFKEQSKEKNAKKASDQRKRKAAEKRTAERAANREAKRQAGPPQDSIAAVPAPSATVPASTAVATLGPSLAQSGGPPPAVMQQFAQLDPHQQQQYLQHAFATQQAAQQQAAAQHAAAQLAAAQQEEAQRAAAEQAAGAQHVAAQSDQAAVVQVAPAQVPAAPPATGIQPGL